MCENQRLAIPTRIDTQNAAHIIWVMKRPRFYDIRLGPTYGKIGFSISKTTRVNIGFVIY